MRKKNVCKILLLTVVKYLFNKHGSSVRPVVLPLYSVSCSRLAVSSIQRQGSCQLPALNGIGDGSVMYQRCQPKSMGFPANPHLFSYQVWSSYRRQAYHSPQFAIFFFFLSQEVLPEEEIELWLGYNPRCRHFSFLIGASTGPPNGPRKHAGTEHLSQHVSPRTDTN